jgi:hypothetical protein
MLALNRRCDIGAAFCEGSCHRSLVPPHRRASGSSTGNLNERRCGDAMLQHEQICVNPTTNDALSLFGSQRVQDRKIVALFALRSAATASTLLATCFRC